jgi:hypothetical protein
MKIDIYCTSNTTTFVCVPHGNTPPAPATKFFKTIDLTVGGTPRIAIDAASVLQDIAARGFAIIGAAVVVDVNVLDQK